MRLRKSLVMEDLVGNFYRLVYEIEDAPGSRMFMVYKTREQAEKKLQEILATMKIVYHDIIELE